MKLCFLVILSALLAVPRSCAEGAKDGFPAEPVFGHVQLPENERLLMACGVGMKITAPALHLKERAAVSELPLPSYPAVLFNAGIVGKSEVLFSIQPDGTVTEIRAGKSTHAEFGDAALSAVRKWKFQPLQQNGTEKFLSVSVSFIFSIYSD